MSDAFDFSKFLQSAIQPDEATRDAVLRDAVADEMDLVMAEVAPRIWCILQEQMMKDPQNNIHLNAVMNAAIFAILGWTCAITPRTAGNDDSIRSKINANLENALENSRDAGVAMSTIAHNVGKIKLMEDACRGVSNVLVSNSMVIKGIHAYIESQKPKGQ